MLFRSDTDQPHNGFPLSPAYSFNCCFVRQLPSRSCGSGIVGIFKKLLQENSPCIAPLPVTYTSTRKGPAAAGRVFLISSGFSPARTFFHQRSCNDKIIVSDSDNLCFSAIFPPLPLLICFCPFLVIPFFNLWYCNFHSAIFIQKFAYFPITQTAVFLACKSKLYDFGFKLV